VSIEFQYDSKLTDNYHGSPAMPVMIPFKTRLCGEIRFPHSKWDDNAAVVAVEATHEDHNFARNEPIGISGTVELRSSDKQPRDLVLLIQIEDMNLSTVVWEERRTVEVTPGEKTAYQESIKWERPGPWRIRVFALGGDHAIGYKAGVVVYDLPDYKPALARPADFWKFWEGAIATQRSLPLAPMRTKNEAASNEKYSVYDVFITGYMGRRLAGKWFEPNLPGRYPVTMGAVHPGAAVVPLTEDGICSLQYSMDGSATYRTGLGNRYTSNLFYNYIDTLRWVDFIASCQKADMNCSIYYAGSRSGPPGIAAMSLDPRLKMYIANVPTNNRWDWQVTLPGATGWGPWAADRPNGQSLADFAKELSYFNSDNFAERVTQPVLIGFGLLDGFSQVTGNLACYARLASKQKKICFRPWYGHADPNEDWKATSVQWKDALFKGTS
jgi:cephalosporin-C deacetylase